MVACRVANLVLQLPLLIAHDYPRCGATTLSKHHDCHYEAILPPWNSLTISALGCQGANATGARWWGDVNQSEARVF